MHLDICSLNPLQPCSMQERCDSISVRLLCSADAQRGAQCLLQLRLMLSCSHAAERSHAESRDEALSYQQPAAGGGLGPLFTASSDFEMLQEDRALYARSCLNKYLCITMSE